MMTKRCLLLCWMLLPGAAWAGEPRSITLDEALRRAEEVSPDARAIALGIERARAEARASGLWPNPGIEILREESAGTVERFTTVSQTLPITGRLGLERSAARSGLVAAEAAARQERVDLRARVRAAFIELLLAQEQQAAAETARADLAGLVAILQAREREGESSGFDRLRAERELAEVEADLHGARASLAWARAVLGAILALPPEGLAASGSLATRDPVPDPAEMRTRAAARGDLAALDAEAERAELQARAARRRAIPEPSITAGTKTTEIGSPDDTGPVIALAFPVPIFDRGQQGQVAGAEGAILRARREALAWRAAAEVEAVYAEVAARRAAEDTYAASGSPDELVAIARAAYDGGTMRILELLDAYRTALGVRLRTAELRAAARRAEARLAQVTGSEVTR
jgi:cobalt-zinc-cadmium efflux system outer membrane protein